MSNQSSKGKTSRGLNIVFVSREQDNDRTQLDDILAKASGILGCGRCHSGRMIVPIEMGDPGPDIGQLIGNVLIDNIFVADKAGNVKTLPELAKGGV